ncbi:MAG: hypothetical protein AB7P35_17795 [Hyphomonadaceae bacterium]
MNSGEWNLTPSPDLSARELGAGLAALDGLLAAGPKQRISAAIIELLAATERSPSLGDAAAAARTEALKQMAWDYPIDVVEQACRDWRKVQNFGRWWPAEQDLRALCEKLAKPRQKLRNAAAQLLSALDAQERRRPEGTARSPSPIGRVKAFVDECRAKLGREFAFSYLSHQTCDFSESVIFTFGLCAERLEQRASGLLAKHGVSVRVCPDVRARVYREQDEISAVQQSFGPSKKRRQG